MHDTTLITNALNIDRRSSAWQRTVDITTTGARTGRARRIEIWFHHVHGRWYLSSTPARRAWYANLLANPRFVFHLKHGVHADLRATAVPITDPVEKRPVFESIVDDFNQPHNPAVVRQPQLVDDWMAGSPLMEIIFTDITTPEENHA
ncbi:nitroreductase/quinone reductase family protein [Agromyces subbeticus]|uniref:nitroreductase/quinone reductase family protein n=1 Tax=Agromyces subbeticus TaxID=293890 RepID=UPI0003B78AFE|nr:nitroreductase/quinone reductase family protein [Agromyces subbeticus]